MSELAWWAPTFRLLFWRACPKRYHSMSDAEEVRENRLRRAAGRQGLRLVKSRRRNPRAAGFGSYGLFDASTRGLVLGDGQVANSYSCDLDEV